MATFDWTGTDIIPNGSGSAVRADLNDALLALFSQNSSATAPLTTVAYMLWADTDEGYLKIRDGANSAIWYNLFKLDGQFDALKLLDGTAAAPSLYFTSSGTDTGVYSPGVDQVGITTAGVQRVNFNGSTEVVFNDGGEDIDFRIEGDTNSSLFFVDAGNDSVSIGGSGRLLVGTSSARTNIDYALGTSGSQLQVEQALTSTNFSIVQNYDSGTIAAPAILTLARSGATSIGSTAIVASNNRLGEINFSGSDGTNFTVAAFIRGEVDGTPGADDMPGRLVFSTADAASSPTERFRIGANGQCSFSNGSVFIDSTAIASGAGTNALKWNSSTGIVTYDTSSRLIKENIEDCPYGIDAIKLLQPRKYFRTDDQRDEIGFVADELVGVLPEFVPVGPKSVITKNEEDTEEIPLGVNYEKLTAVLTKALQEAIDRIEILETEVAALKGA